jgi:hypothetical protein
MARARALNRARRLREALLDHGVPQVSIELVMGRPGPSDRWNGCNPVAVMSHHIASYPTQSNPTPGLSLVKRGRSDLSGPLCNGTAGMDLVYRIVCMGWANHSGEGGPWVVRGPLGAYRIPRNQGRPYIWGTEYEGGYDDSTWDRTYQNPKTKKKMTFREFMGRANAGLVEGIWAINGKGKNATGGMDLSTYHGEHGQPWAEGRKPDRRGYTAHVSLGRREIRRWDSKATDIPPMEVLVQMDVKDIVNPGADKKDQMTAGQAMRITANQSVFTTDAQKETNRLLKEILQELRNQ